MNLVNAARPARLPRAFVRSMLRHILPPLGASLAVLSIVIFAGVSAGGQSPAAKKNGRPPGESASQWKTPRTAWGDPDLQGTWNNGTTTPLERARAGGKELLSKKEDEEVNAQLNALAASRPADRALDLEMGYDQVWWDRGSSIGRTSLIVDPKNGRLPPLTADGRKLLGARLAARSTRGAFDSWIDRPLQERCIMSHGVPPLPTGYNNNYQIAQSPGLVAILHEEIHEVRLIHLGPRPHIGASIRQWLGDSRGHWEGDALVVETTNFHEDATFRFPADAATLRVVERLRRTGADAIDYEFTVDNPTVYTRPWSATLPMRKGDGLIYEYACHEGNHAIASVLGAHRAEEKAAEEAARKNGK